MVINELCVGDFFKPPRLIYQVYHMFFVVRNSILCYLHHAYKGTDEPAPCVRGIPPLIDTPVIIRGANPACMGNTPCRMVIFSLPEPSQRAWEIRLLTRVNTSLSHISRSLCVVDESRIFLDGDPQASYLVLLVLTCDTNVARPFILSRLSQARLPSLLRCFMLPRVNVLLRVEY